MSDEPYDSRSDTREHIIKVRQYLENCVNILNQRALQHDQSKLEDPEKEAFDRGTPGLKGLTYGSDEYKEAFAKYGMKDAIKHHYAHNSHHPEHYALGVSGMSLFDVLEMLVDWKAASERHADGDFQKSLEINEQRFNISTQLQSILIQTSEELGFL